MKTIRQLLSFRKNASGQAVIEIALFGAILIFLIGIILRTHLSLSFGLNHQVRAMKVALKQSYSSSLGTRPTSSRNSGNVLFIEDRLSPDFNKFNTIDRSPFIANGSGTMTNRLDYPVDFGEVDQNLPIMDLFVNGQHFPLTTASYVFKIIYSPEDVSCPPDWVGAQHGIEFVRCLRQKNEWKVTAPLCPDGTACPASGTCTHINCPAPPLNCPNTTTPCDPLIGCNVISTCASPTFYTMAVNGTSLFKAGETNPHSWDLLRNDWDVSRQITPQNQSPLEDNVPDDSVAPNLRKNMGWQWQATPGNGAKLKLGTEDAPLYPTLDSSGTLREQTVYAASQLSRADLMMVLSDPRLTPYMINPSPGTGYGVGSSGYNLALTTALAADPIYDFSRPCPEGGYGPLCISRSLNAGNITGVVVLDYQLGDMDPSYDPKSSPGPQPGLTQQMSIYSWVHLPNSNNQGTYLQIKEGKLYNPEEGRIVRSVSSKDHVDLISRVFQLSNNTQRFCKTTPGGGFVRAVSIPDQGGTIPNPVDACGDCSGANIDRTCFDPVSRVLFIRTLIGDTTVRKWFTDVSKGL